MFGASPLASAPLGGNVVAAGPIEVSATFSSSGTMSANVRIIQLVGGTLAATGSATGTLTFINAVKTTLASSTSLNAAASGTNHIYGTLAAAGTVSATAIKIYANPILSGSGFLHFPSMVRNSLKPI